MSFCYHTSNYAFSKLALTTASPIVAADIRRYHYLPLVLFATQACSARASGETCASQHSEEARWPCQLWPSLTASSPAILLLVAVLLAVALTSKSTSSDPHSKENLQRLCFQHALLKEPATSLRTSCPGTQLHAATNLGVGEGDGNSHDDDDVSYYSACKDGTATAHLSPNQ